MYRRQFLRFAGAILAQAGASVASAQASSGYRSRRPFSWRDAEGRTSIRGMALSPDGTQVAIEVSRALAEGGEYAGPAWATLLDLRGDIWLLDGALRRPRRLSRGKLGVWSACFSADGRRLAALTLLESGRVGLIIWDMATQEYRIRAGANIELFYATFGTARLRYGGPTGFGQVPRKFVWFDATSILAVDHGPDLQQSFLAIPNLSSTIGDLRRRTESGEVSVRVWNDSVPTCGASSRLVKLQCDADKTETLYKGDVRGVSLSPNRQWLALLVATGNIPPRPGLPMPWALRQTTPGDDTLVTLKLTLVRLGGPGTARDVAGVISVGPVAPSRLPVWSEDSERVAVPVRTTYSDVPATAVDDSVWEVFVQTGVARKVMATSALDAERLAAVIAADGLHAGAARDSLSPRNESMEYPAVGQIQGGAWRCGAEQVMLWNPPRLSLITRRQTIVLPGDFTSVQPPTEGPTVARTLAVRADRSTAIITTWTDLHRIDELPTEPGWDVLGVRASDGAVIYKDDAATGTFLILARIGKKPRRSTLSFNTYFRFVARPQRRVLTRKLADGTMDRGILHLPIDHRTGDRHPTIMWAYPNSTGHVVRSNSDYDLFLPVEYLLTKGFAFFEAPFPIGGRASLEPERSASDAVLPWLDVLDREDCVIPANYGFFGHSNAGYVALALECLTDRFKAIVAWSTFPAIGYDVLHSYLDNLVLNCTGNILQSEREVYEDRRQPYTPRPSPPWKDPAAYIRNDPIFDLNRAVTPLLLVEGEFDMDPRETESVYSILHGKGVPVELAYYWGEGHVFSSPGNIRDSWLRTERFFGKYLRK